MIIPTVRRLLCRSYSDHKISSTRSESHLSLSEPLLIPKRSLSSATLYTNDEQVSEVTSTNELNKEEPTFQESVSRLQIENINYSPTVLLHCIDALIKRSKEVAQMKCGHCPKKFTEYSKLVQHLKIHDRPTQRMYECDEHDCNEAFLTKRQLKTHECLHRRSLQCRICKKNMNLAILEFNWHESMCRGLLFDESLGRLTRSKSICMRNEESVERMYKARMELWQRPDASECDIDPEEQKVQLPETSQRGCRKLNKKRRNSRSASVYQEEQSPVMDDTEYMNENDDLDSYFDTTSVISRSSKVSRASRASMYSQSSTKSKPISISIRSNYSLSSRNDYSHMSDEALVKVHQDYSKRRKRTRSLSKSLAKVELELECRTNRLEPRDDTETGVEINHQTKRRMIRMSKNVRDFTCQEFNCVRSFRSLNELMKHEQETHNYLPMFRCVICKACFTKKTYLIKHRDVHHQQVVNCPLCLDVCASIEDRKAHIDLHLVKTFICAFCDMGFVQESLLAKHELDVHGVFSKEVKMDVLARKILKQRPQSIEIISRHFYANKVAQNDKKKTLKFPANGYNIIRKQYTCRQYSRTNYNKPSQLFDAKLHEDKSEDESSDSCPTKDIPNYLVDYDKFESDNSNNSPETVISHESDKYDDFEVPKPADDTKVNFQPDDLFNYLMLTHSTNTG